MKNNLRNLSQGSQSQLIVIIQILRILTQPQQLQWGRQPGCLAAMMSLTLGLVTRAATGTLITVARALLKEVIVLWREVIQVSMEFMCQTEREGIPGYHKTNCHILLMIIIHLFVVNNSFIGCS